MLQNTLLSCFCTQSQSSLFDDPSTTLQQPSETLRSLTESKRMLEETKRELAEARERAQLSPTHTFSALPGFFDRPAELKAIERSLDGEPSFTVLFGASSVGKTALLRQVLTRSKYLVLHFDLRIAGFADLASLYMSLSQQMEGFFMGIAQDPDMPGYESFEKQAWGFKHDRLSVERRIANASNGDGVGAAVLGDIKTSDIARLMELFQSSLLRYWKFQPFSEPSSRPSSVGSANGDATPESPPRPEKKISRMRSFWTRKKSKKPSQSSGAPHEGNGNALHGVSEKAPERPIPQKKVPIFFIDEAHKLPALIRSTDAMKCLLDAMLVLTKQDRDYPKLDTRRYFRDRILPNVPERLRSGLDFERLYDAFGGKLAHWQDYVADYVNSNGRLEVKQSSHFLQAHSLLNLHVIHSAQAPPPNHEDDAGPNSPRHSTQASPHHATPSAPVTTGTGFRIYSPLVANADPHASPPTFSPAGTGSDAAAEFTAIQLLKVMNRFAQPGARALSYFLLCREIGARAVDGMVRGRILDLRWTDPISKEGWDPRIVSMRLRESTMVPAGLGEGPSRAAGSGTMVNESDAGMMDLDDEMVALSEEELMRENQRAWELHGAEEEEEIVGPKLVPTTPIMRYAMREVVQEYYDDDDERTVSEYASLSGVDEY
ncbi:hypothetical protein NLI96_g6990 [Meripilus lineatus]|uniref:Uncharacterized protein n=1 Tax=Meripilus lineatus TaxID=2056292 RepID=A0AAD5V4R6_9APHY|nr:hypothetical protein NLI96_g6990 [Physisporinus lineatus]